MREKTIQELVGSSDPDEARTALSMIAQKFAEGMMRNAPQGLPSDYGVVIVTFTGKAVSWAGAGKPGHSQRAIEAVEQVCREIRDGGEEVPTGRGKA